MKIKINWGHKIWLKRNIHIEKKHVFNWFTPKINRICSKSPHIQYFLRLAQAICYHTMVIPTKKNGIHLLKQNKHHRSNPQLYPPKATPCPFPENAWVFHLANDYQNWSLFDLRKCCLGWRNVRNKDIYRRIMTDIQFLSLETSIRSIYILTASSAWPLAFHIHPCWAPSSRFQRQDLKQYLSIYRMEKCNGSRSTSFFQTSYKYRLFTGLCNSFFPYLG